jgi:hypothetical protein
MQRHPDVLIDVRCGGGDDAPARRVVQFRESGADAWIVERWKSGGGVKVFWSVEL